MAQEVPHGHQDAAASDDHSFAPPTSVTYSLTSPGPNNNGGSSNGILENKDTGKGKNLIPDLKKEEAEGSKGKRPAEEVAAADGATRKKRKRLAADDAKRKVNLVVERERRKRMNDLYKELHGLMPHVPEKADKGTILKEAIEYIKVLEKKKAAMEKEKQEMDAARAAAPPLPLPPPPPPAAAPVPATTGPAGRFRTWAGRNVVLTVAGNNAYISVWAPRGRGTLTMASTVLDRHGIDVVTFEVESAGDHRCVLCICANLTQTDGELSSVEVYQLAVSEIMIHINAAT